MVVFRFLEVVYDYEKSIIQNQKDLPEYYYNFFLTNVVREVEQTEWLLFYLVYNLNSSI